MKKLLPLLAACVLLLSAFASVDAASAASESSIERPSKHVSAIWPCEYFKPHSGDDLFFFAWNNETNPYTDSADCAYDHPQPTGGQHLRCIIEWHHFGDGTPINPPGYTWQNGWC